MIPMRMFAGWSAVAAMALGDSRAPVELDSEVRDPANLTGEQVQPSVTERHDSG